MKLSPFERLSLVNQYRILDLLSDDEGGHDNVIEALRSGYEGEYNEVFISIYEPLSADECLFVRDVLWL